MMLTIHRLSLLTLLLGLCVLLSGCIQGQSYATTQRSFKGTEISDQTLRTIDRELRRSLSQAGWQFKTTKTTAGGTSSDVNTYIRLPAQLDLDQRYQSLYLRQSVCPMITDPKIWQALRHLSYSVHLYTEQKSDSIQARCDNPMA